MYATFLLLHSWIRWIALIAGAGATVAAWKGGDDARDARWGRAFVTTLDIQMLLGLLMYFFVSPNMAAIRDNFGEAMRTSQLRFWAVEHVMMMLIAVVLAHVGQVLARKATSTAARRRRQLVCYGLALALILAGMPWPGLPYGRPLFRP